MEVERLLKILQQLPDGDSEVFLHPASDSRQESDQDISRYRSEREYQALIDPRAVGFIRENDIQLITFSDLSLISPG